MPVFICSQNWIKSVVSFDIKIKPKNVNSLFKNKMESNSEETQLFNDYIYAKEVTFWYTQNSLSNLI